MKIRILLQILVFFLSCCLFYGCKPEEIQLHGDLTGLVTDDETGLPVDSARVVVSVLNDTVFTASDGIFIFRNLPYSNYEIIVSHQEYETNTRNVLVNPAIINEIDFSLTGIPRLKLSTDWIDFGLNSISATFTVSNFGKGRLTYGLIPLQRWIFVDPAYGEATTETDIITVRIDRTGLPQNKRKEILKVISMVGKPWPVDTVSVMVNGVMDPDLNYYGTVTIGTQIWLSENLKTTKYNDGEPIPLNESGFYMVLSPAYCWFDNQQVRYGNTYGALYNWYTVNTRKLCPSGWHVPSVDEMNILRDFLGGNSNAGGKLKETGTSHWWDPNFGATNETGFTALPGGCLLSSDNGTYFGWVGQWGNWSTSTEYDVNTIWSWSLGCTDPFLYIDYNSFTRRDGLSVRCIKDP
jgi:uncharacterized protein (TIGR02145 family)